MFAPVPPRRHYENLIEHKHGIIRTIYLRLNNAAPDENPKLHSVSADRISNEMYGSDTLSAYEIAKGFAKLNDFSFLFKATIFELIYAHDEINAKQNLTQILLFNASRKTVLRPGDLFQIYFRTDDPKRGKWLSLLAVLNFDPQSGVVTVPSFSGRQMHAAVERCSSVYLQRRPRRAHYGSKWSALWTPRFYG